ncbi:MAG: methyltransferase domain-containing protein, partial [Acidobacteriota bacterium]|nr:methyltransferase domain-containing protein [Acidobacteriota bacterium]
MADRWDSALYDDRHSFVWKKGAALVDLLAPEAGERVLDLGCGTGHLTAGIAARGAEVTGVDSSPSMIALARQNFPRLRFQLCDARDLRFEEPFDAVFSNAVLHWIPEADRVAASVSGVLKPGGRFVLEMGVKHNVDRIVAGVGEVLRTVGYPDENPWYYPSLGEYARVLEDRGFEVLEAQTFPRWSRLEHPERGLREWLEMFGGFWFERVPSREREGLLRAIEDRLRPELFRDGSWW